MRGLSLGLGMNIFNTPSLSTVPKLTVLQAGQSLGEYPSLRGSPIVALKFCEWLRSELGMTGVNAFTQYTGRPYITTDATTKTGTDFKVRYVNAASGGSNLVDASAPANIATGNYWRNTQNNSATSPGGALDAVPNTAGPLQRAAVQAIADYGADLIMWSQGQTDLTYVGTASQRAIYKAQLLALFSDLRAAAGNPNLPIVIQHFDRNQTYADTNSQIMVDLQTEVALENPNIYIGVEEYFSEFAVIGTVANCSMTSGNDVILTTNTANLFVGQEIRGAGIQRNSYILSISAGVSFTLDKNAIQTLTSQTLVRYEGTHPGPGAVAGYDTDQNEGFYNILHRICDPIKRILVGTARKEFGPKVTTITPTYGGSTILLGVTHDRGTDLTTRNGAISALSAPFFRVENNGSAMTVTNVERIDGSTLRLTVSGTIADGTVYVWSAYGAMNKTDHQDMIIDNSPEPMPLTRASPKFNLGLRSYTDTGRTDLQSAGFANVVAQWDATLSGSYDGFDTYLRNLTANPADGSAKAAYDLLINAMSFSGVSGLTSGKLVSAGTTSCLQIPANTAFLNNLHKTSGGQPVQAHTLVMVFTTPNVTTSAYLMSTFNSTSEPGYAINFNAGALATRQRGDTASIVAAGGSISANTTYLYIESKSAGGSAYSYWVNTRTGTVTTLAFNTSVTDASSLFRLFARSPAGQGLIANSEFKGAALLNIYADNTLAAALADYYNTLHGTTYA